MQSDQQERSQVVRRTLHSSSSFVLTWSKLSATPLLFSMDSMHLALLEDIGSHESFATVTQSLKWDDRATSNYQEDQRRCIKRSWLVASQCVCLLAALFMVCNLQDYSERRAYSAHT